MIAAIDKLSADQIRDLALTSRGVYRVLVDAAVEFCERNDMGDNADNFIAAVMSMTEAIVFAAIANNVPPERFEEVRNSLTGGLLSNLKLFAKDPDMFKMRSLDA